VLTLREASFALFGAWRLAHLDAQGAAYFDRTPEGALRSFWAAALLLPAYAVLTLLHLADHPPALDWPSLVLIHGIGYVVGWTAFPVAMIWIVRLMDHEQEYFGYLAMYNWSQVLVVLVALPMAALRSGPLLPEPLLSALGLAVDVAIMIYLWFIARAGLGVGPFAAIGVVVTDLTISILIWAVTDWLSGVQPVRPS
jgi:hypothetical protein